jgi:uncharacterized membrane protein YukC
MTIDDLRRNLESEYQTLLRIRREIEQVRRYRTWIDRYAALSVIVLDVCAIVGTVGFVAFSWIPVSWVSVAQWAISIASPVCMVAIIWLT